MDADAIMDVGYMKAYGLEALTHIVSDLLLLRRDEDDNDQLVIIPTHTNQDHVLSAMLFAAFLSTLLLLYFFPIPA